MDQYITGAIIKRVREERKMTQAELAEKLCVSDKAVSKWETGRGYPDITLVEPLAAALGLSVTELLSSNGVTNKNRSCNLKRLKFYVCPLCGNIITATGEAVVSCCGVTLPPLEAEKADAEHFPEISVVEDEYFVSLVHEMTKKHYISFLAAVADDGCEIKKLYPEGNAEARFKIARTSAIYAYCNRHGLFKADIIRKRAKRV